VGFTLFHQIYCATIIVPQDLVVCVGLVQNYSAWRRVGKGPTYF
jgi:hypothetical protein